jgi:hypothetical protein
LDALERDEKREEAAMSDECCAMRSGEGREARTSEIAREKIQETRVKNRSVDHQEEILYYHVKQGGDAYVVGSTQQ